MNRFGDLNAQFTEIRTTSVFSNDNTVETSGLIMVLYSKLCGIKELKHLITDL